MPTVYPGSIDSFYSKTDGLDTIYANDVNELQAAVTAIESELGTDPAGSEATVSARIGALETVPPQSGWITAGITWVYASATTFTITGDYSAALTKGMKYKLTANSVELQGYILSATYSAPNTTVTVVGDTLTNHTFTDNYYSTAANPAGFTHWFNWSANPTGYSSAPANPIYKFRITGESVECVFREPTGGTSNATSITYTAPVVAKTITDMYWLGIANCQDNGANLTTASRVKIQTGTSTITVHKDFSSGAFTASGNKCVYMANLTYEI